MLIKILIIIVFVVLSSIFLYLKDKYEKHIDIVRGKIYELEARYFHPYLFILFAFYGLSKVFLCVGTKDVVAYEICKGILLVILMINICVLVYIIKMMGKYTTRKITLMNFSWNVFLTFICIIMCYAVSYNILFDCDKQAFGSFENVDWWHTLIEFSFFSFNNATGANVSEIIPKTFYARFICCLEVLTTWFYAVVLLANYKSIGRVASHYFAEDPWDHSENNSKTKL